MKRLSLELKKELREDWGQGSKSNLNQKDF